jgi:hypothetical protein
MNADTVVTDGNGGGVNAADIARRRERNVERRGPMPMLMRGPTVARQPPCYEYAELWQAGHSAQARTPVFIYFVVGNLDKRR